MRHLLSKQIWFYTLVLSISCIVFPFGTDLQAQVKEKQPGERPNILVIYADDLHHEHFGFNGNEIIQTPHIDQLAQQGVVFENAFANSAICKTSRGNFMTGRYAARTGIYHGDFPGLSEEILQQIFPSHLNRAGYHTGYAGKWHLGSVPDGIFDDDRRFRGQGKYWSGNRKPGEGEHLTERTGRQAAEMIHNAPSNQPFSITVGFKAPHVQDGFHPTESYPPPPSTATLYELAKIPVPPNSSSEFFNRQPDFIQNSLGRNRWNYRLGKPKSLNFQRSLRRYYRMVTGIDRQIGKMMKALSKTGRRDNTIIIVTSDHGLYLGERGLAGKWLGHEPSMRIPLVVYDPRLPENRKGTRCEELVNMIDFHPTFLDWAGVSPNDGVQGRSFAPLVKGDTPEDWRDAVFYEYHSYPDRIPASEGVRTGRYKYLRYVNRDPVYEELYDLQNDPNESQNLADDPEHTDLLKRMRKRWRQMHKRVR